MTHELCLVDAVCWGKKIFFSQTETLEEVPPHTVSVYSAEWCSESYPTWHVVCVSGSEWWEGGSCFLFRVVKVWLTVWMDQQHIQTQTNMWSLVTRVFCIFWISKKMLKLICKIKYFNSNEGLLIKSTQKSWLCTRQNYTFDLVHCRRIAWDCQMIQQKTCVLVSCYSLHEFNMTELGAEQQDCLLPVKKSSVRSKGMDDLERSWEWQEQL